jgi:hypothetical protein
LDLATVSLPFLLFFFAFFSSFRAFATTLLCAFGLQGALLPCCPAAPVPFSPSHPRRPDVMGICSSCLGNRRRDEYDEVRCCPRPALRCDALRCCALPLPRPLPLPLPLPSRRKLTHAPSPPRTTRPSTSSTTPTACTMAASTNNT